jgi:ATP-dependent phosphofructokinase / diphosphate-dependent phosphofructokinase
MIRRIGILTGGGDCPGLNPAVKWVTKTALDRSRFDQRGYNFEVVGLTEGWRGLVAYEGEDLVPFGAGPRIPWACRLSEWTVRSWDRIGGTMLGSSRTNPYNPDSPTVDIVLENIKALKLDALVAIGGEDTQSVAARLWLDHEVPVVGIPKTIDKDLIDTDYTLGFETAVQVITEEIDRIRTTAGSHSRTFIVEAMGRHAGHLALQGGIAAGADVVLIPEVPFDLDRVADILRVRKSEGHRYSVVVVAEGAHVEGEEPVRSNAVLDTGFGHVQLGGVGEYLEHRLSGMLGAEGFEFRSVVLSHIQRGGSPGAYDRRMGRAFGVAAVSLIEQRRFGRMVAFRNGRVGHVAIPYQRHEYQQVDVGREYDTQRYTGKTSFIA